MGRTFACPVSQDSDGPSRDRIGRQAAGDAEVLQRPRFAEEVVGPKAEYRSEYRRGRIRQDFRNDPTQTTER